MISVVCSIAIFLNFWWRFLHQSLLAPIFLKKKALHERQTVFFSAVNPMNKNHKDPQELGLTKSVAILAQEPFPVQTCAVFFPFSSFSGFVLSKCLQPSLLFPIFCHGTCERRNKCADTIPAKIITDLTWCRFIFSNKYKTVMAVILCGFIFSN